MSAAPKPDLTNRWIYRRWCQDVLRYADTDRQGHVNNAVFATFCESGRTSFLCDPATPLAPVGTNFVIARLLLDFLGEILWPGRVDIGTGVLSLGRSSFTLGQGIYVGDRCHATAETVIVLTDEKTRRSTPLPEDVRKRLIDLAVAESPTI
ncbi:thioesterase family protein [Telmatospirillum sp.]|uniref:acyl-CoA thioesterase n=1 Tax=Telmatospirillum sp. TaxID=2079197 RepID=UPI00283EF9B6|nr:thioesterase family protein [Telmatospirillum sp.]MDR3439747.1 thioesterase family protein [Telmatospirillum sp.]